MIYYWLVLGKSGAVRLSRWYVHLSEQGKAWVLLQLKQHLLLPQKETDGLSSDGGKGATLSVQQDDRARVFTLPASPLSTGPASSVRVVYRHYGTLFFVAAINEEEVPLAVGELIDMWTGLLRQLLGSPGGPLAEAQLASHMETALLLLDCMLQQGYLLCSDKETLLARARELMKLE